jgi:hypothetical protein
MPNNNNNNNSPLYEEKEGVGTDTFSLVLFDDKQQLNMVQSEVQIMKNITKQMSQLFHKELRKLIPIQIPTISEDYFEQNVADSSKYLELNTSLFNEGYLIYSQNNSKNKAVVQLVELNEPLIKANNINPILSDAFNYVDKESVLNNIEKRLIAPTQNTIRFGHEEEADKRNEKKLKQEQIAFESKYELEQYQSDKTKKSKKKTAGKGWFNMEAPELTEELKQELMAIKLQHTTRGSANQKTRDNKPLSKEEMEDIPQFFQIGTIQEAPNEFYSDRVKKRDRQQSFLDELLHEEEQVGYVSKRYSELQDNLTHVQKNKKKRLLKKFKKARKK